MPDDLLPPPDTATSAGEADLNDDVYEAAFQETMSEDLGEGGAATDADADDRPADDEDPQDKAPAKSKEGDESEEESQEKVKEEPSHPNLTTSEQQALRRAKIPEEAWKHLSRDAIEQIAEQQRAIDRIQAEAGRQKAEEQKAEAKPEPVKADPNPGRFKETFDRLADVYGDEIGELGSLLSEIDSRQQQVEQVAQAIGPIGELLVDAVVDRFIDRLEKDNPTASKPEVRKQIRDRFRKEWKTGEYQPGEGESLIDVLGRVVNEAGRVTLAGVSSEAAAVAALVSQNKDRLKSQPKFGGAKAKPKPLTEDDVYDQVAKEVFGENDD